MTDTSPSRFAGQPVGSRYPLLAGQQFPRYAFTREDMGGTRAHIIETANGGVGLQLGYAETLASRIPQRYQWVQEQPLTNEDEVLLVDRLTRSGETVLWVPFEVESEVFDLAGGAQTFSLARSEARAAEPAFPATSQFPNRAWVDGVEKTVVTSSPADSSEVQVTGTTVAVTGATAGQQLTVRYYPAYSVTLRRSEHRFVDSHDQARAIQMFERA